MDIAWRFYGRSGRSRWRGRNRIPDVKKEKMKAKKGDNSWVWGALVLFVLMKLIYEILGVVFSAMAGDTRAIVAGFTAFYIFTKIGDKVARLF